MKRKDKGTLHCYASGDGALHFSWCDYDQEKKSYIANSNPVTVSDAKNYLNLKEAKHLKDKGYRVITLHGQTVLVANVKRTSAQNVTLNGQSYTYDYGEHKLHTGSCDTLKNYHALTLTAKIGTETIEVQNLSVKAAINHYLTHEWFILAASLVADRNFILPELNCTK